MTDLALPDPQAVALAEVPALVEQVSEIRQQMRIDKDERIVEVYDRLGAVRQYIKDRKARCQLEGEERRVEVVIGELLRPAGHGGDRRSDEFQPDGIRLNFDDKLIHAFRKMHDHEEVVEAAIAEDVTARAKILRRIDRANQPKVGGDWRLIESSVADLDIGEPADVIVTDPPYRREHLPAWRELGKFAERTLKPGGSLVAMSGQSHLPDVIAALGKPGLRYHWTLAYLTPGGQAAQVVDRSVNAFWKPVLWFVKGSYEGKWLGDVVKSAMNDNDKASHDWGQSESGMTDLVKRVSEEGDLVVDPFVGGGATAVAALRLGRRFVGADADSAALLATEQRLQS